MSKICFPDSFHLGPRFLKTIQSHKGEIGVLVLMKVIFGPHPKAGLVAGGPNL